MKNLRSKIILLIAGFSGLGILIAHCGVPKRPEVSDEYTEPAPDHLRFTAPCASCHEANRPAIKDNVAHGFGRECGECHQFDATAPWKPLPYSHNPPPTECLGCHASDRPGGTHPQTGDCVSCHRYPSFLPPTI